jgi:hypothetical protein
MRHDVPENSLPRPVFTSFRGLIRGEGVFIAGGGRQLKRGVTVVGLTPPVFKGSAEL